MTHNLTRRFLMLIGFGGLASASTVAEAKTRRFHSVTGLRKDKADFYIELHAEAWPGVLKRIKESNIRNYSIFRYGELLFAYMEYVGEDLEADLARMAADPITQAWWEVCGPLQSPVVDRDEGEWWKALPEVFHLD